MWHKYQHFLSSPGFNEIYKYTGICYGNAYQILNDFQYELIDLFQMTILQKVFLDVIIQKVEAGIMCEDNQSLTSRF